MFGKPQSKAEVLQGTLDLLVLQTLDSLGPLHGYAIAARFEQVSTGVLQLNMGTLYPALMRLEQRGLVRGSWATTDSNRKARFYGGIRVSACGVAAAAPTGALAAEHSGSCRVQSAPSEVSANSD